MRFHCLIIVRDEEDIIDQSLDHLLSWSDGLYMLDMGSTDATWDIINDRAKKDSRIVPFRQRPYIYRDAIRGVIFHQFRDRFDPGDWIVRADIDEIYHIPPPQFVRERVRWTESAVWLQWYFFRLTQQEVADYESGKVSVHEDRKRLIQDRRRYYKISQYGEPRMFKYRRSMRWSERESAAYNAGYVARERIPILHYPHRDPVQMEKRFRLRAQMSQLKAGAGKHWAMEDWRGEVVDANGIAPSAVGKKQGLGAENGIDTGPLLHWEPGTPLQEVPLHNHIPAMSTRLAQRILHPLLLPLMDPRRTDWDPNFDFAQIPPELQAKLASESQKA